MEFWEEEYRSGSLSGEAFDWFFDAKDVGEDWWRRYVPGGDVLVIGCGHSSLSGILSKWCRRVVSTDSSKTCIDMMRSKNNHLEWRVCDARQLPFDDESFDVVVDKGCADALLAYASSSKKNGGNFSALRDATKEAHRVLRDRGHFVVVTCTRQKGVDVDGFGGDVPTCLSALEATFRGQVERSEVAAPNNRGLAPNEFDDVRPKSYAVLDAVKLEEHLIDYHEHYDARPEPNEAFVSWTRLSECILPFLSKDMSIVDVGCGNSAVGPEHLAQYCKSYEGIDAVKSVVEAQRQKYPKLRWRTVDARDLDQSYDIAFDKGTADALFMYGKGNQPVLDYISALERIAVKRFILVSCARGTDDVLNGKGHPRILALLSSSSWTLKAHELLESDVGAGPRTFDFLVFERILPLC